mgnify:FL=1
MKYLSIIAVILGVILTLSFGNAQALLSSNKSYMFSSDGFAIINDKISDSSSNFSFSIIKAKEKSDLNLQSGIVTIDQKNWNLSDLKGTGLQNGKLFKFNAKATDPQGKSAIIDATAKLVDTTASDAIYTISGTFTQGQQITKLVYISKLSEITSKPSTDVQKSQTVKILLGAANPHLETYKTQTNSFKFNFLSQDRITILPGSSVTFVNEDNVPHSLASGIDNTMQTNASFIPDGKITSGDILPGQSWTVTYNEKGFYRLFDTKYKHIDITIFVYDTSKIQTTKKPLN